MSDSAAATRRHRLLLGGVLLLAAVLRLHGLGAFSLWYDEAASVHFARFVDLRGSLFKPDHITEAPAQAVFTRAWLPVADAVAGPARGTARHDFALRLWPFAWGMAAVAAAYLAARALLRDRAAAVVAALLVAISPFQIHYAQELRIYSFYAAVALAALWCMARALDGNRPRHWLGLVALLAILPYAHFFSVWTIFAFNAAYLAVIWPYRRRLPQWFAANLAVVLLVLPALLLAARMDAQVREIEYAWYDSPTWKTGLITFKSFFAGFGPAAWAYWPLFALAGALCAWGAASLAVAGRWPAAAILLVQIVVPVAGNVALWGMRDFSYYQHRLFIVSGAAAAILAAQGVAALRRPALIGLALALLGAFTLPGLRDHYAGRLHPVEGHRIAMWDKVDLRSAAAHIGAHWREGDLVAHASHFTLYPMRHYLDRPQVRLGAHEHDADVFIRNFGNAPQLARHGLLPERMDRATGGARRVWFIETHGTTFEYKPHTDPIRAGLDRWWRRAEDAAFAGVAVTRYDRPDPDRNPWPPNILLVVADTLRADRVHADRGGKPVMPALAALARRGVDFRHAYSPSSWTKPSMASILGGLHPETHGVILSAETEGLDQPASDMVPENAPMIAAHLAEHGYSSFAFQTNANCTEQLGFARGFTHGYAFANGARAEHVADRVLAQAATMAPPFFLYAHFFDPHAPYDPPETHREIFGPLPELPEAEAATLAPAGFMPYYLDTIETALGIRPERALPPLSPAGREAVRQLYDAECRYLDDHLARLVDTVLRQSPNTVVVIVSDHGEEFWEHASLGHGVTLFEEQARVPLIVLAPGLAPAAPPHPVGAVGVAPTIAALAGLPPHPAWQGGNLVGAASAPVPMMTHGSWSRLQIDLAAIVDGPHKYIADDHCGREHLFDLEADPGETANLADALPEVAARLRGALRAHEAAAEAAAAAYPRVRAAALESDLEELRALGYLGAADTDAAPPGPRICP